MDYTYIIYTFFVLLFWIRGKSLKQYYDNNRVISLAIATLCLIIICILQGGRYEVGTDWIWYCGFYDRIKGSLDIDFSDYSSFMIEPIYALTNILCAKIGFSYQAFFGLIAGIQILLYSFSFRRLSKYVVWGMLFYCLSFLISTQNITRQTLSTTIFIFSAMYLAYDNKAKYLIGCLVASLTHYSTFITLPLIALKHNLFKFLDNKTIGIILFICSFVVGTYLISIINQVIPTITQNEKYISNLDSLDIVANYNSGLGRIFMAFTSILIIVYSNKIIKAVKIPSFYIIYRFFLIGVILQNAFSNSMFLQRVPFALISLKLILLSVLIPLLIKGNIYEKILGVAIVLISCLGFYMTITAGGSGCSPYILKF